MSDPQQKHGVNWMELMKLVAPVVGEVAGHGDRGAFLQGFMEQQQRSEVLKKQQAEADQKMHAAGADFMLQAGQHAQGITDPVDYQNYLALAEHAGTAAGYTKPGELTQGLPFNTTKAHEKQLAELSDELARLEKEGYNLDEIAGQNLHLKSGQTLPIGTAMEMTRQRPTDATGKAIPRPPKVAASIDERAGALKTQIRAAKAAGDTAKAATLQAQYDDIISTASDMRAPVDPTGSIEALRQLALNKPPTEPRQRFNVQPITNPDGTLGLVRINMDTGETTRVALPEGTGAGKASDTQRLSAAYYQRTTKAQQNIVPFEKQLVTLGPQADVQLPTLLQSEQGQLYAQGRDEFINAALRRESGAAIAQSEYDRYDRIYFVRPGDTAAVIKQKQAARERVIQGFKLTAGTLANDKTATGPSIGERKLFNGQLGEWDGKGWKPVNPAPPPPLPVKAIPPGGGY